jgi:amidase/aspartyl-tRNA(Asn)/glutamyl-tRNA(Gln) amidotransferase subunit A
VQELTWYPAWRIRDLIATRQLSPVEVTEHYLGRAEELNGALRCYQELDVQGAREQAAQAERAVRRGAEVGPLHGVPVSIKAHVAVAGFNVYAMFGEPKPPVRAARDAPVVDRLRRAGAIVLGTNTMPGMGLSQLRDEKGVPTTDLSHHSRNPWDLTRVPGSSSAGGAAAVAAGVIPIALGSDGGGSTRLPAAWCGIVGLHPTMGRVPSGGRGASNWNTTLGPLTRDARDTAVALQAMAGPHGGTVLSLQDDPPDYLGGIDAGVEGMRFAWTDDFGFARTYAGPESERVLDVARASAARFADLGASVEPTGETWEDWWPHPTAMMDPEGVPYLRYQAAEDARERWWATLRRVLTAHDLLLTTTIQHVAFEVERWSAAWSSATSDYPNGSFVPTWTAHTFIHNWLGWPALSIPCGFVDGMPVGLQITGRPNDEARILQAAHAYLRAFPPSEPPDRGGESA